MFITPAYYNKFNHITDLSIFIDEFIYDNTHTIYNLCIYSFTYLLLYSLHQYDFNVS